MIKRIAPDVEIIDITHGIPPQHVLQGALVLANTLPYMPVGVHVAIVDPGVGGDRKPVALAGSDGRLYVGPDNGVLVVAADSLGGVERAVEIANTSYMLDAISRTFHGRDIFSPASAHLASGVALEELGPALDPGSLVRLELPAPEVGSARIRATALYVDRFGNIQLNLTSQELELVGIGHRHLFSLADHDLELDAAAHGLGQPLAHAQQQFAHLDRAVRRRQPRDLERRSPPTSRALLPRDLKRFSLP